MSSPRVKRNQSQSGNLKQSARAKRRAVERKAGKPKESFERLPEAIATADHSFLVQECNATSPIMRISLKDLEEYAKWKARWDARQAAMTDEERFAEAKRMWER